MQYILILSSSDIPSWKRRASVYGMGSSLNLGLNLPNKGLLESLSSSDIAFMEQFYRK